MLTMGRPKGGCATTDVIHGEVPRSRMDVGSARCACLSAARKAAADRPENRSRAPSSKIRGAPLEIIEMIGPDRTFPSPTRHDNIDAPTLDDGHVRGAEGLRAGR